MNFFKKPRIIGLRRGYVLGKTQRRFSPCGLFSRAEDKVKLSDDEIEELLLDPRQLSNYFTRCAILWAFCRTESPIRVPETPSAFPPRGTTKRFPSLRCASAIQIVSPVGINR
jgi:hypothetical protein